MSERRSYPKGVAKREEILERALDVVAQHGYRGASVKQIADAVGLTQAGMLYHFGSKEQLWTDILRKRDELDRTELIDPADPSAARDAFIDVIEHNSQVPGLVELFAHLAVEAVDPEHPAHEYFVNRGSSFREKIITSAEHVPGRLTLPPETTARILQAVADGLQLQWLLDRDVDMAGTLSSLVTALVRPAEDSDDGV